MRSLRAMEQDVAAINFNSHGTCNLQAVPRTGGPFPRRRRSVTMDRAPVPLRSARYRCREHRAGARWQKSACFSLNQISRGLCRHPIQQRRWRALQSASAPKAHCTNAKAHREYSAERTPQQHVSRHRFDQRPDTVSIFDHVVTRIVQAAIEPGPCHVSIGVRQQAS